MRTTLLIDDDILVAAKQLAEREHKSIGAVISNLARLGLAGPTGAAPAERNGIPLLSVSGSVPPVTLEMINHLRDE